MRFRRVSDHFTASPYPNSGGFVVGVFAAGWLQDGRQTGTRALVRLASVSCLGAIREESNGAHQLHDNTP
jgi:hypothetical protein